MDQSRIRVLARVAGRVQGVGFRYACAAAARSADVSGWVRNLPDGTVEAVFEGQPAAVEAMLGWVQHGPDGARITSVSTSEERPRGDSEFGIR